MQFTTKSALDYVGGLSSPSKMPCFGYSIPASKCITGRKLAKVEGTICSKCYAMRGNYGFESVQRSLLKRWRSLKKKHWVEAMVVAINGTDKSGFFRWHDSGDLQGVWHLARIADVAWRTPHIQHWLPTREYSMVSECLRFGNLPTNLTVRLSSLTFEGPPPTAVAQRLGLTSSGASKTEWDCPAYAQGGFCGDCRRCWDPNVFHVTYKRH